METAGQWYVPLPVSMACRRQQASPRFIVMIVFPSESCYNDGSMPGGRFAAVPAILNNGGHCMNDTMDTILGKIASPDNAYGGGGVSALAGSLGTALARMVCHLQERKAEPALQEEYVSLLDQLASLENRLLSLFEEDAKSFEPLQAMYKVRPKTDEEKRDKAARMEGLLEQAARTPLDIMETGCAALRLLDRLADICPKLLISDIGIAVSLCHTCVKGAEYNVAINAGMLKNPDRAAPLLAQRDRLRLEADTLSAGMMRKVEDKLG